MAAGRIMNRALLQSMARFFGIEGVKQAPAFLNLEQVIGVYDLSRAEGIAAPGGGSGTIDAFNNVMTNIVGESVYDYPIIAAAGSSNPEHLDSDIAYRIDTLDIELNLDSAGATLLDDSSVDLTLFFREIGGDPPWEFRVITLDPVFLIHAGQLNYRWALRGYHNGASNVLSFTYGNSSTWNGRVDKSTMEFLLRLEVRDGTNFPANTQFRIKCLARASTNGAVPDN